ncbi:MAG: MarR family transcriptional regulator [Pyrinomonadaceae bacterium]
MNDLDAHLGYLLRRISNQVSGEFARSLKARSISVAEWVVLSRIAHELGITSSKLTDGLNLTRGAISKIVEKLESKGLVSRESIEGDARVKELYLTDKGTKLLPQLVKIADDNDRRFFEGLTDSEQQILRKVLHKLAAANEINEIPIG